MKDEIEAVVETAMAAYEARQEWWDIPADPASVQQAREKDNAAVREMFKACETLKGVLDRQTDTWNVLFSLSRARYFIERAMRYGRKNERLKDDVLAEIITGLVRLIEPLRNTERIVESSTSDEGVR